MLIDAVRDLLPIEVWDRPKQGFVLPFAEWMRGPLAAGYRECHEQQRRRQRQLMHTVNDLAANVAGKHPPEAQRSRQRPIAQPVLPGQEPLTWNVGHTVTRTNATQRPPRAPALVRRLGHVVLQTITGRVRAIPIALWFVAVASLGVLVAENV